MSPDQGLEALLEDRKSSIEPSTIKGFNIDRPFQTTPFFPRIYGPCHSRKSINRATFLLQRGRESQSTKRPRERSKTALAPLLLLDHRRSSAKPPPKGPTVRRTTT
ncbi:hypothetical protein M5K25_026005 [Dendrobium thyrsiflorum]|uniref:Uncharacterized protein n=1 Tax=Dendrobium thyrsiflorum TaxID=117978 RepID=A0ABD0TW48_DENTH